MAHARGELGHLAAQGSPPYDLRAALRRGIVADHHHALFTSQVADGVENAQDRHVAGREDAGQRGMRLQYGGGDLAGALPVGAAADLGHHAQVPVVCQSLFEPADAVGDGGAARGQVHDGQVALLAQQPGQQVGGQAAAEQVVRGHEADHRAVRDRAIHREHGHAARMRGREGPGQLRRVDRADHQHVDPLGEQLGDIGPLALHGLFALAHQHTGATCGGGFAHPIGQVAVKQVRAGFVAKTDAAATHAEIGGGHGSCAPYPCRAALWKTMPIRWSTEKICSSRATLPKRYFSITPRRIGTP